MRALFAGVVIVGLVAGPAYAQMTVTVEANRVRFGSEFVPRFLDLPTVLQVKKGEAVTLPPDATFDYVEVAGTLDFPSGRSTLRATHIINLPGGLVRIDETDMPEIVIRDVPIDVARDPLQWGNGFLNFGRIEFRGRANSWRYGAGGADRGARPVQGR